MTKIDIFSGFLGAGKTTLIKKLIAEAYKGEKLVLIENEFGDVGIDGGFLKDSGITINEMNSGCICCTLVGDFAKALEEVLEKYAPDRILIEPSGVGKLSDIIGAVSNVGDPDKVKINSFTAVVDAGKCKMYMKNFGEFFNNQIECAKTIILSRTQTTRQDKLDEAIELIRKHNAKAVIIATPWDDIDGAAILAAMEKTETFEDELLEEARKIAEEHRHEHHHHHHDDDDDHDEHEHHHGHHHHDDHDGDEDHHDDDDDDDEETCSCGCGHHHHHDHHADEVFESLGFETTHKFTEDEMEAILTKLDEDGGAVLRSKGIVQATDGGWIHFDYVPVEHEIRRGPADVIGRIVVIGSELDKENIKSIFGL